MPHSPKRPCFTFEPGFETLSATESLLIAQVPTAEEEDKEETASISSCSFTFSYPSTSPPPSPLIPGMPEEEQEQQEEREPASVILAPPRSPQNSSASWSTSDGDWSSQEEKDTHFLQASADTESLPRDPLDGKVADLVHFMILKYRLKEPITKAEMLKAVSKRSKNQFPMIFKKASKCLEVISGIYVKEVDPQIHSYVLVNSLDLTNDKMLSDDQSMPKNGLLIIILGVIFIEGNCAPEENIWDFLNIIGVYAGREHFIYGEPRKLITRDWVQENYLEYRKVPHSDPPRYEFLWGKRAHAETSKVKVMEFLAKIKMIDPVSFSFWYEKALKDEEERAGAINGHIDSNTDMFTVQYCSAASPPQLKNEPKSSVCVWRRQLGF